MMSSRKILLFRVQVGIDQQALSFTLTDTRDATLPPGAIVDPAGQIKIGNTTMVRFLVPNFSTGNLDHQLHISSYDSHGQPSHWTPYTMGRESGRVSPWLGPYRIPSGAKFVRHELAIVVTAVASPGTLDTPGEDFAAPILQTKIYRPTVIVVPQLCDEGT